MREFLEHAAKKYYDGEPIISDEQFDVLADVYKFNDVGHQITDGIPHIYRMYSLQKFFNLGVYFREQDAFLTIIVYHYKKYIHTNFGPTPGDI